MKRLRVLLNNYSLLLIKTTFTEKRKIRKNSMLIAKKNKNIEYYQLKCYCWEFIKDFLCI